jgi:hypothetical protein
MDIYYIIFAIQNYFEDVYQTLKDTFWNNSIEEINEPAIKQIIER